MKIFFTLIQDDLTKLKQLMESELLRLVQATRKDNVGDQDQEESESLYVGHSAISKIIAESHESAESESLTGSDKAIDEIQRYCKAKAPELEVLTWWKNNEAAYPSVTKLATKYLCIPATSTSSEPVFSTAGSTANELRSSLTGGHVEAWMFLKANPSHESFFDLLTESSMSK